MWIMTAEGWRQLQPRKVEPAPHKSKRNLADPYVIDWYNHDDVYDFWHRMLNVDAYEVTGPDIKGRYAIQRK